MGKKRGGSWSLWVAMILCCVCVSARAESNVVNDALVKTELYIWNRVADFLEIVRCGAGAGPAIGGEIAFTEYGQLGAYAARERGTTFPHIAPPLWIVPYLEDEDVFRPHSGVYWTRSFGPKRRENTLLEDRRFKRDPMDVRGQLGLGLGHVYMNASSEEFKDFWAGVVGIDLKEDDEELDPNARRYPAEQLGRGVTNICVGAVEIPRSMVTVTKQQGDFAGATTGLARGIYRCLIRESVGVIELVTFPMGWSPIVEPAYPYEPGRSTEWRVNTPQFRRRF